MELRYRITVDKDSFQEFYWKAGRPWVSLNSYPQPEDSEDFVIASITNFQTGEDLTVKILREYSEWLNTRD